ncbi:MAG: hypothetical protein OEU92_18355 [Alphaproteobacteria bacterium]|nr:hypothetical protein [Alphaproteobacteria bacterium]
MIQKTLHYLFGFASTFPFTPDRYEWVDALAAQRNRTFHQAAEKTSEYRKTDAVQQQTWAFVTKNHRFADEDAAPVVCLH